MAELATAVSMSRSNFALRFRDLVGLPPLDYLVRWRIQRAARELRSTQRTVATIGADLGYTSQSAFSNTFKRVLGQSPARYRREHAAAVALSAGVAEARPRRLNIPTESITPQPQGTQPSLNSIADNSRRRQRSPGTAASSLGDVPAWADRA